MTTFVLHLFLPKTINFVPDTPPPVQRESPLLTRKPSAFPFPATPAGPLSILRPLATPDISQDEDSNPFFKRSDSSSSIPAHAGTSRPSLARTDSVAPDWGQTAVFNQPYSRAPISHPATILEYAAPVEKQAPKPLKPLPRKHSPKQRDAVKHVKGTNWDVERAIQGNGGLMNAIQAAVECGILTSNVQYLGTVGFPTDDLDDHVRDEIEERLESKHDCLSVFVGDENFQGHYRQFCKVILWPVFHYQIPDHVLSKAYMDDSWVFYVRVNEAFAEKVCRSYKQGDTIWIHDYQLILVPSMIRKKISDAKIGFFLHVPFPSSEIFRCLARRKDLLMGVLGADLVVFQADEYAYHFLQTCSHLLNVEATDEGVQLEDRFVNVACCPLGIVPEQLNVARREPTVEDWIKILEKKYEGKTLIVATDKLEGTRGLRQKILAYERFLNDNQDWKEKVVLIQVAMSTTGEKFDLDGAISDIVNRIDARHGTLAHQPIVFLKQDIDLAQHLALLSVADVLMITSLRDGMNLTCHEYIICQDGTQAGNKEHGTLILSEFTGAATVFNRSDIVPANPWDIPGCAKAIKTALDRSLEERISHHENLYQAVLAHNALHWIQDLGSRLDEACASHSQRDISAVPRLSTNDLIGSYKDSNSRLFILDYEGTLAAWGNYTNSQRALEVLRALIFASVNNLVYVASSRRPEELEHLFQTLPGIGLIAENGCFVRPFNPDFSSEDWIDLAEGQSEDWKTGVKQVLQYYMDRIEGAELEERHCSLVLTYDNVKKGDAEAARNLAGDCANHMNDSCKHLGIRAVPQEKAIQIELKRFSKRIASAKVFAHEQLRLADKLEDETDSLWIGGDSSVSGAVSPTRGRSTTVSSAVSHAASRSISRLNTTGSGGPLQPWSNPASPITRPRDTSASFGSGSFNIPIPHRGIVVDEHPFSAAGSPLSGTPLTNPVPDSGYMSDEYVAPGSAGMPSGPHFLMVAGDSREDEAVFRWAHGLGKNKTVAHVSTVNVGKRQTTEAKSTLSQGVPGLLSVLNALAEVDAPV